MTYDYLHTVFKSDITEEELGLEGFVQAPFVSKDHPRNNFDLTNLDSAEVIQEYKRYRAALNRTAQEGGCQRREAKLNLCTLDQTSFRIYISPENWIDSNSFQNKFCTFMMSLQPEHNVRLVLGASLEGWMYDVALGSLITALSSTKANVVTSVVGQCGSPETYLWLFGKQRTFSRYGDIRFSGVLNILKQFPAYHSYFDYIFSRAIELGILTEDDKTKLLTSNDILFFNYTDLKSKN